MTKYKISAIATSFLAVSLFSAPLLAESHGVTKSPKPTNGTMDHSQMNQGQMNTPESSTESGVLPTEPGQGAFATIAEIVALLNKDPNTDWSKVNIDALREHLVDMDEVTLRANAKTSITDTSITFTVTGSGRTKQAIQTMVPAHVGLLPSITPWKAKTTRIENGATLTVTASNQAELQKLKALGFFGVMATGAHHQPHHFALAKGDTQVHARN